MPIYFVVHVCNVSQVFMLQTVNPKPNNEDCEFLFLSHFLGRNPSGGSLKLNHLGTLKAIIFRTVQSSALAV